MYAVPNRRWGYSGINTVLVVGWERGPRPHLLVGKLVGKRNS
jgi:hypothetical protein